MKKLFLFFMLLLLVGFTSHAQCVASFSGVQNPTGNNLLNVDFTNSSTYGTVSFNQYRQFQISYGDGSSISGNLIYGTTTLPSHVYAAPGAYTVTLTASKWDTSTHATVCSNTTTIGITVAYPACGTVVSATGTGAARTFNASNPAGTTGITYAWNFGDGSTGTGASPAHTYATYGSYGVSCISTAGAPASCTYYNTVSANIAPSVSPPFINCGLTQASLTATVGGGGTFVNCTNTSTILNSPFITREKLDFGDGTISYTSGTHFYAATGTYTVQLTMDWYDTTRTTTCTKTATKTVTITSVASATIEGEIGWDSTTYKGPTYSSYKVWLIQFDPATNILFAVDSQFTTLLPSHYSGSPAPLFSFTNKPPGNYLVKAALNGGATSSTGIIPTYCQYSALWSGAKTIAVTNGSKTYDFIDMLNGTVTSGPGFVGGNVALGANKGASGGVSGMLVLLQNASQRIVQMTTTDPNGNFSFSNIPAGSYTVHPELMNYATTPASVTVATGNTSIVGVNFHEDDVKMNIKPLSLAVGAVVPQVSNWTIFPNPANGDITVSWKGMIDKAFSIIVTDVTGKKVMQTSVYTSQQGRQKMDISSLRPGLYILQSTGASDGIRQKLVVQ